MNMKSMNILLCLIIRHTVPHTAIPSFSFYIKEQFLISCLLHHGFRRTQFSNVSAPSGIGHMLIKWAGIWSKALALLGGFMQMRAS